MFRVISPAILLAVLSPMAHAEDKIKVSTSDIQKRVESYLNQSLPGVFYSEEKDVSGGRIVRLFAVGTAPIRQSLGEEDGLELAQQQAQIAARAELARFLASKVSVKMTARDEVVITKGGSDAEKESAKKTERRTQEYEETATAVLRGLKIAGAQQVAGSKRYVVVYRWELKGADAASEIGDRMDGKPVRRPASTAIPLPSKRILVAD